MKGSNFECFTATTFWSSKNDCVDDGPTTPHAGILKANAKDKQAETWGAQFGGATPLDGDEGAFPENQTSVRRDVLTRCQGHHQLKS